MDLTGWTYNPKEYPDAPDRLFILWPYQVEAAKDLQAAMGREDRLIEKSRDMGATWLCLAVMMHRWMFLNGQSFMLASRKEELVDKTGDMDALFPKLEYLVTKLPLWMQPEFTRIDRHFANLERNNTFDGETTNSNLGAGGRRTAMMLDELGRVDNAQEILDATRDVTRCRIMPSTYCGAYGGFYKMAQHLKRNAPNRVIRMHWTLHPEKSFGLEMRNGKPWSPWYQEQLDRTPNKREIAEQLDINPLEAGYQFFDGSVIETLVKAAAKHPPVATGTIIIAQDGSGNFRKVKNGELTLWIAMGADGKPPHGEYGVACDIALGTSGEHSSESTASIVDRKTGRKVGMFASNNIEPRDFARYAVALCMLFHNAKLIWEDNGPGRAFNKAVFDSTSYRNIYLRKDEKKVTNDIRPMAGWWSDKDSKFQLLSEYREALHKGRFVNLCEKSLRQCNEYVVDGPNRVVHGGSLDKSDPTVEGENHGDRVISDALANKLLTAEAKPVQTTGTARAAPLGSLKWRMEVAAQLQRAKPSY